MDGSLLMKKTDRLHENAGKEGRSPAQPQAGHQHPFVARPPFVLRHSFVVRIWQEESDAAWRGWVEYTRTGEATFVQELGELLSFIEGRTGKLGP
jgi:hypothetical protein